MLPFLKPRLESGVINITRKPDGTTTDMQQEGKEDQGFISAIEDMIRAVHAKDAEQAAEAFRNAFEMLEKQPHEEADHSEDSTEE